MYCKLKELQGGERFRHIDDKQQDYPLIKLEVPVEGANVVDDEGHLLAYDEEAVVDARRAAPPLNTEDYRYAPGGEGPQAATWKDKPHRLIYDLCTEVERLRAAREVFIILGHNSDGAFSVPGDTVAGVRFETEAAIAFAKRRTPHFDSVTVTRWTENGDEPIAELC